MRCPTMILPGLCQEAEKCLKIENGKTGPSSDFIGNLGSYSVTNFFSPLFTDLPTLQHICHTHARILTSPLRPAGGSERPYTLAKIQQMKSNSCDHFSDQIKLWPSKHSQPPTTAISRQKEKHEVVAGVALRLLRLGQRARPP